jgi:hypothetical protein
MTEIGPAVASGGGVSDPLTVGPIKIGTGLFPSPDNGGSLQFIDSGATPGSGRHTQFYVQVEGTDEGDASYAGAEISAMRNLGSDAGSAFFGGYTNTADISAWARDDGETNITIKGNSGQTGPEILVKDSSGSTEVTAGLHNPEGSLTPGFFSGKYEATGGQYAYLLQGGPGDVRSPSVDMGATADDGSTAGAGMQALCATNDDPTSLLSKIYMYTADASFDVQVKDNGNSFVSIQGNSGQSAPEIIVKDSSGVTQFSAGTNLASGVGKGAFIGDTLGDYATFNLQSNGGVQTGVLDTSVAGDSAYAEALLRVDRVVGSASSGLAQLGMYTNDAYVAAEARDLGDTFLSIKGNASAAAYILMQETGAAPSAPPANTAMLFSRDNGSGKTQICVRFPTGAVQVIATEP